MRWFRDFCQLWVIESKVYEVVERCENMGHWLYIKEHRTCGLGYLQHIQCPRFVYDGLCGSGFGWLEFCLWQVSEGIWSACCLLLCYFWVGLGFFSGFGCVVRSVSTFKSVFVVIGIFSAFNTLFCLF